MDQASDSSIGKTGHRTQWRAVFWLGAYITLAMTPLVVLLLAPTPAKGGFVWDMGIALGFSGLIMLVLQFFITARLRRPAAPFGMDVIYYFHRCLAYALLAVVLAHPLLLVISNPAVITDFSLQHLSWAIVSGMLALGLLLLIVVSSVWRTLLRLPYDIWRVVHLLLSISVVVLAFIHMWTIDYYSSTPLVKGLWLLIAVSLPLIVFQVRLYRPLRLTRTPWQVAQVTEEAGNCWTLTIEPDGHKGFDFQPGQFCWLSISHSPLSMQEHPFSIASAPQADGSLQFTIKELGDFTSTIGDTEPGTRVYVDGPYGIFSCERHPQAPGYVFIGGGIGIAPLIGMLKGLSQRSDTRPHVLFSAHSEWDRIPRRDEILALGERLNLTVVPVLESPPEGWDGESGYITTDMLKRYLPDNYRDYHMFLCGPPVMLDAVRDCLDELQVPPTQIHSELFEMA